MIQPMLVVLAAALILSGVLAGRLSRRIVEPLNTLDLDHPLENDVYEELTPLLKRINAQHREIETQICELSAHGRILAGDGQHERRACAAG